MLLLASVDGELFSTESVGSLEELDSELTSAFSVTNVDVDVDCTDADDVSSLLCLSNTNKS